LLPPPSPVGTELELAAVVSVEGRVGDFQQIHQGRRIRRLPIRLGDQFGDVDLARLLFADVVDEEAPVRREVRVQGDREQPALAGAAADLRAEIDELADDSVLDQLDLARALDHEEPAGVAGVGGDVGRLGEAGAHRLQRQRLGAGRSEEQHSSERGGEYPCSDHPSQVS